MSDLNDYPVIIISHHAEFCSHLSEHLRDDSPVPSHAPFEVATCNDDDFASTLANIQRHDLNYCIAFVDAEAAPGDDTMEAVKKLWMADKYIQVVLCLHPGNPLKMDYMSLLGSNGRLVLLKKPFEKIEVHLIAQSLHQKYQLHQHIRELAADDLIIREQVLQNTDLSIKLKNTKDEFNQLKNRFCAYSALAENMDNNFNVPLQDIKNNIRILEKSFEDINLLLAEYKHANSSDYAQPQLERIEKRIDLKYIKLGFPDAARRIDDAIERLSSQFNILQDVSDLTHGAHH